MKFSKTNSYADTKHKTIILANALNISTSGKTNMQIVRAFIKLIAPTTSEQLERKIPDLEAKYDKQFRLIFQAIRKLIHGINGNNN